ncbi:hypothetical protein [Scytonema sp. HK-05]|uniref:hypothetical protein n=1 Tax=Scytonema sp. HK-05 TaxID=1137095 RepID=UPI0011613650|nr:hypothetical protein [Scytonema sp. HK-05]
MFAELPTVYWRSLRHEIFKTVNSYLRSDACYGGGFKPALRVCLRHVFDERHLLYLGKPQDRSGSPPTLSGPIGGGLKHAKDETDN